MSLPPRPNVTTIAASDVLTPMPRWQRLSEAVQPNAAGFAPKRRTAMRPSNMTLWETRR